MIGTSSARCLCRIPGERKIFALLDCHHSGDSLTSAETSGHHISIINTWFTRNDSGRFQVKRLGLHRTSEEKKFSAHPFVLLVIHC